MLETLIDAEKSAVAERRAAISLADLQSMPRDVERRPFSEALTRPGLSLIAEFKRRSPTKGDMNPAADITAWVAAYERGGAAALSVITQTSHFDGVIEDVAEARGASTLPILFKTFVVDRSQLHEAVAAGADAVLLMVSVVTRLEDTTLAELYEEARALDLDCLVEVRNEKELQLAADAGADTIGINNRSFEEPDFTENVEVQTTLELMKRFPAGKTAVSESGIHDSQQLKELSDAGVDAVLVGETLMRADDPEAAVRNLLAGEEPTSEHQL
jgi:indole-3-glycerol phosphate synthase